MLLAALAATAALAAQDTSRLIDVPDSGQIVRVGAFQPRQYLGDEDFPGGVVPNRLSAEIRGRKVKSLTVAPYGAGD
jgi:hypothetical protein